MDKNKILLSDEGKVATARAQKLYERYDSFLGKIIRPLKRFDKVVKTKQKLAWVFAAFDGGIFKYDNRVYVLNPNIDARFDLVTVW